MKQTIFTRLVVAMPVIVTLFVTDQALDPFNIGKFSVLLLGASLLLLTLPSTLINFANLKENKLIYLSLSFFCFAHLITIFLTKQDIYRGLMGVWGRNNGFLSYLSLAILFFCGVIFVNKNGDIRIIKSISFLGTLLSIYGLMQSQNADFFHYTFIGSPVFLTLGNEDFSSVFLVISIICTLFLISVYKSDLQKIAIFFCAVFQIYILFHMNTAQSKVGLISSAFIFMLFKYKNFRQNSPRQKYILYFVTTTSILTTLIGLIGIGPLSFINQNLGSLNSRYLHWVAGWKMFTSNLIYGVGIDSYGDFQPEFRILDQNNIPDTYSNNAHNLIVQFLSTGGILLFAGYVLFMFGIAGKLKKVVLKEDMDNNRKILYVSIFVLNLFNIAIGIDNLALIVWFWIFTSSIVALSNSSNFNQNTKRIGVHPSSNYSIRKISTLLAVFSVFLIPANYLTITSFVYELQLQNLFVKVNKEGINKDTMEQIYRKGLQHHDPDARMLVIKFLYAGKENNLAYKLSLDSLQYFPRNLRLLESTFQYNRLTGNNSEALRIKNKMIELDPLNPDFKNDLESISVTK